MPAAATELPCQLSAELQLAKLQAEMMMSRDEAASGDVRLGIYLHLADGTQTPFGRHRDMTQWYDMYVELLPGFCSARLRSAGFHGVPLKLVCHLPSAI